MGTIIILFIAIVLMVVAVVALIYCKDMAGYKRAESSNSSSRCPSENTCENTSENLTRSCSPSYIWQRISLKFCRNREEIVTRLESVVVGDTSQILLE